MPGLTPAQRAAVQLAGHPAWPCSGPGRAGVLFRATPYRTGIAEAQDKAVPVHVYDPRLNREIAWIYEEIADRLEKALA